MLCELGKKGVWGEKEKKRKEKKRKETMYCSFGPNLTPLHIPLRTFGRGERGEKEEKMIKKQ